MTGLTASLLTESQFAELRGYEDGLPVWREVRPSSNLIRRNLLTLAPSCGLGFYRITPFGLSLLAEFREKHGLPEGV